MRSSRPLVHAALAFLWCVIITVPPTRAATESRLTGLPSSLSTDYAGSARSAALASANLALTKDSQAVYENPAGLGFSRAAEISLLYLSCHENTGYDFIGVIYPWEDNGTFGLGWARLSSLGFVLRDASDNIVGDFGDVQNTAYLSYGRLLTERLGIGASLKMNFHDIYQDRAAEMYFDAAVRYSFHPEWSVSLLLQNFAYFPLVAGIEPQSVPLFARSGIAWSPDPSVWGIGPFTLYAQVDNADLWNHQLGFQAPVWDWKLAAEYEIYTGVRLLAGCKPDRQTLGLGIQFENFVLDYALDHRALGNLSWLSLRYLLTQPFDAREVERLHLAAFAALDRKDYRPAISLWSRVLRIKPMDTLAKTYIAEAKRRSQQAADALFEAASAAFRQQDWDTADNKLKELLALDPDHAGADQIMADVRKARQEHEAGEKARRISRLMQEAGGFYQQAKWEDALRAWEDILELDPSNAGVAAKIQALRTALEAKVDKYFSRGITMMDRGRLDEATDQFRFALKIVPGHLLAKYYLSKVSALQVLAYHQTYQDAVADLRSLRYETALQKFKRVQAWNPKYRQVDQYIEILKAKLQSLREVLAVYAQARRAYQHRDLSEVERLLAPWLDRPEQLTAEILKLRDQLRQDQAAAQERFTEGLALYRSGNFTGAVNSFESSLKLDQRPDVQNTLAQACTEQGILAYRQNRLAEAVRAWEQAQRLGASDALTRYIARARKKIDFLNQSFEVKP